jgi:hypothetical protein
MAAMDQRISVIGLGYVDLPVERRLPAQGTRWSPSISKPGASGGRTLPVEPVSVLGAGYCPVAKHPFPLAAGQHGRF